MAEIILESGKRYDDISTRNENGEIVKIGVAIYDLEDAQVRANVSRLKDELKTIADKYNPRIETLQTDSTKDEDGYPTNVTPLCDLYVDYVNDMIKSVDYVFGEGFCKRALGDSKNPFMLWEMMGEIIYNYEGVRDDVMAKYTNRAQRRAGAKANKR